MFDQPLHSQNNASALGALSNLAMGTDLVYVPRLKKSYQQYGEAFFRRMLTEAELAYCRGSKSPIRETPFIQKAAGKIAIKEATSKALGVGINGFGWSQGVYWHDLEIVSQSQSPPSLLLTGRALKFSNDLGIREWRLSLSHDGDYAMATVIGLILV